MITAARHDMGMLSALFHVSPITLLKEILSSTQKIFMTWHS